MTARAFLVYYGVTREGTAHVISYPASGWTPDDLALMAQFPDDGLSLALPLPSPGSVVGSPSAERLPS